MGGLNLEDLFRNESTPVIPGNFSEETTGSVFPDWTHPDSTDYDEETTTGFFEESTQPEEETTTYSKDIFETSTDGFSETEPTQESSTEFKEYHIGPTDIDEPIFMV